MITNFRNWKNINEAKKSSKVPLEWPYRIGKHDFSEYDLMLAKQAIDQTDLRKGKNSETKLVSMRKDPENDSVYILFLFNPKINEIGIFYGIMFDKSNKEEKGKPMHAYEKYQFEPNTSDVQEIKRIIEKYGSYELKEYLDSLENVEINESAIIEDPIEKDWLPDVLYHVSPIKNKSSILNNGIELKTGGSTYLNRTYEPRIYLATSLIAAYDIQSNFNSHTDLDYIIFEIDTKTLNGKFYEDSKFLHGVWTDTKIDKKSIIKIINPSSLHYNEDNLENLYNSTWMDYEENK